MPLIFLEKLSDQTSVGTWLISEPLGNLSGRIALSNEEKEKYTARRGEEKKKQFLAARLLLSEMTGKKNAVHYLDDGRPYIEDLATYISISHSGRYVSVAVSPVRRIGADIEIMPRSSLTKGISYFLNSRELLSVRGKATLEQLHVYWSAKEALFKYAADNTLDMKEDIFIRPFAFWGLGKGYITGEVRRPGRMEELLLSCWLYPGYVLVVTGS